MAKQVAGCCQPEVGQELRTRFENQRLVIPFPRRDGQ